MFRENPTYLWFYLTDVFGANHYFAITDVPTGNPARPASQEGKWAMAHRTNERNVDSPIYFDTRAEAAEAAVHLANDLQDFPLAPHEADALVELLMQLAITTVARTDARKLLNDRLQQLKDDEKITLPADEIAKRITAMMLTPDEVVKDDTIAQDTVLDLVYANHPIFAKNKQAQEQEEE